MDSATERGKVDVDLKDMSHSAQYEIADLTDGWFTLTIWYRGKSCSERVARYTINPRDDVKMPHAPMLLGRLLRDLGNGPNG
jgi:hypothetical protein